MFPKRAPAPLVGLVLMLSACSTAPPVPTVSGSAAGSPGPPSGGPAWIEADVEQPELVTAEPSSGGGTCSPCHPPVNTRMRGVVRLADSGLVAVGTAAPGRSLVWLSRMASTGG